MKKSWIGFVFVSAMLLFSMIGFASAQTLSDKIIKTLDSIGEVLDPILRFTLGEVGTGTYSTEVLVIKFLLFVLLLSVAYFAVGKVPGVKDNAVALWVITIGVSVLGARFMSSEALINFVWLPSGILGVALTSLLPFIIFFFFIESFSGQKLIRRVGWVLFGVLYIGLAIVRWDSFLDKESGFNLAWLYVITAILAGLCFLFDRPIQVQKEKRERKKSQKSQLQYVDLELSRKLREVMDEMGQPGVTKERMKKLEEMQKGLEEQREKLNKIFSS